MKTFNEIKIIGVDHGYGNIKTANHCFRTGITAYDSEPLFTKDMLVVKRRSRAALDNENRLCYKKVNH